MRQLQQQKEVGTPSPPPPSSLACGFLWPLIAHAECQHFHASAATTNRGGLPFSPFFLDLWLLLSFDTPTVWQHFHVTAGGLSIPHPSLPLPVAVVSL